MDENTAIPEFCSDVANEATDEVMQDTAADNAMEEQSTEAAAAANEAAAATSDDGDAHNDDIAREAAAEYLPTAAAYVIMDPNHPEPLMQLPIQLNDINVDALIDNAATLNFVSQEFVLCRVK